MNDNIVNNNFRNTESMPVLFVGHGTPMNAIQENEFTTGWQNIGKLVPKPDAILCISAHWVTRGTLVTAMEKPKTIHDFGGFPKELYNIHYPAPGSPELADEIKRLIKKEIVGLDNDWGLDHGCWSVMKHIYPNADIPIVQLSLDYFQEPQYHYELAKELLPLRKKGVMIVCSGNMVHNLRLVDWERLENTDYGYDWAIDALEKMKRFILTDNHKALIDYKLQGNSFKLAIPTNEHYLPMIYALALKEEHEKVSFFNDKNVGGSLAMTSFIIEKSNQSY
ncbi:4,5-DOPA dioxygenase extradiol [Bacteroides sedimenti]|uniref:Dioxygenase n=1 Tax=Bacteroides sedimenti TaxID=2136147 RepID=A0ABN6Z362_9BACE